MKTGYARTILLAALVGFGASEAQAAPIMFTTTGVFSVSGTNVASFSSAAGTTTVTFHGITDLVNTPAGADFGDFVVTSTVPPNILDPTVTGTFTLNFSQVSPAGTASLIGTLSGNLGFNTGIATLMFPTTSMMIDGFTYTINQLYTVALPVTGIGAAGAGMTTLQGTIVGAAAAVPDNGNTFVLFGAALLGLVAVQRRLRSETA